MSHVFSRNHLHARWAAARHLGWWNLLLIPLVCTPLIASAFLLAQGIELIALGAPGTVTITGCETTEGGWNCDGAYTSADGSITIERVRIYPYFPQEDEPSGTVQARVSGPQARRANTSTDPIPVPLWGGLAMGLVGLYWFYRVYLTPGDAD